MKIQHPLIQDSMLHGSFVTTSTLHNDCKMHTRKAYEISMATVLQSITLDRTVMTSDTSAYCTL